MRQILDEQFYYYSEILEQLFLNSVWTQIYFFCNCRAAVILQKTKGRQYWRCRWVIIILNKKWYLGWRMIFFVGNCCTYIWLVFRTILSWTFWFFDHVGQRSNSIATIRQTWIDFFSSGALFWREIYTRVTFFCRYDGISIVKSRIDTARALAQRNISMKC